MPNLLFIYGTLKRGERNNHHMRPYEFLRESMTLEPIWETQEFAYRKNAPLTPILTTGRFFVRGELYALPNEIENLKELDAFEGKYYQRKLITLEDNIEAWSYFLHDDVKPKSLSSVRPLLISQNIIDWQA